jgi:hypothetical protein
MKFSIDRTATVHPAGIRAAHGLARSNSAATRSSLSSSPGLAINWIASGIPAAIEAARQADRRVAGQIERHGVGIPGGADVLDALVVDLDRAEKVLIDRQSRPRQSRHRDDVRRLEPGLHLAVQPGPGEDRLVQFGGAVGRDPVHLADEGWAHDGAVLFQMVAELRPPIRTIVDEPHRFRIFERSGQFRHRRSKFGQRPERRHRRTAPTTRRRCCPIAAARRRALRIRSPQAKRRR